MPQSSWTLSPHSSMNDTATEFDLQERNMTTLFVIEEQMIWIGVVTGAFVGQLCRDFMFDMEQ